MTVNVARSAEEAEKQARGEAVGAQAEEEAPPADITAFLDPGAAPQPDVRCRPCALLKRHRPLPDTKAVAPDVAPVADDGAIAYFHHSDAASARRKQSGHRLPEPHRRALIQRERPAHRRGRVERPSLEVMGEFGHVGKPLGGIGRDRAAERGAQPGRQIGAQRGEIARPLPGSVDWSRRDCRRETRR